VNPGSTLRAADLPVLATTTDALLREISRYTTERSFAWAQPRERRRRFYEKARHVKITGLQVRFLHGVFSNGFGLCGTDVLSAGLTTSFPAVNKITSLGSIGRVGDTEKGLWDFGRPSLKKMIDFIAHLAEAAEQH
jgi:hypothetical protein